MFVYGDGQRFFGRVWWWVGRERVSPGFCFSSMAMAGALCASVDEVEEVLRAGVALGLVSYRGEGMWESHIDEDCDE